MTARFFATSSSNELAVAPSDFTALEQKSLVRILAFARDPGNKGRELMLCLDTDGTVVHDESEGDDQAPVTDKMRSAMAGNKGVRLWHNHPSQQSLSHCDWWNTGIPECLEVLAVNESGTIYVGRLCEWDDRFESVLKRFPVIAGLVEFKIDTAAKAAGFTFDQVPAATILSGHVLNLAMKETSVVCYASRLSDRDQAAFDFAAAKGVIESALTYATSEIRGMLREAASEQLG